MTTLFRLALVLPEPVCPQGKTPRRFVGLLQERRPVRRPVNRSLPINPRESPERRRPRLTGWWADGSQQDEVAVFVDEVQVERLDGERSKVVRGALFVHNDESDARSSEERVPRFNGPRPMV